MSATAKTPATTPPLPALRQDVVITLPDRQQYRGRVSKVTDHEIAVVPLSAHTRRGAVGGDDG